MGAVRSSQDHTGMTLHGIDLGEARQLRADGTPAQPGESDVTYVWEDAALPNGVLNDAGTFTADPLEHIGP